MHRLLILIPLLLIGCTATISYDDPIGPSIPELDAIPPEVVDPAIVADWAERVRQAGAGISRWVQTSRGNVSEYLQALRRVSAEMRKYLAGAGEITLPLDREGASGAGETWGQPNPVSIREGVSDASEGVRLRGELALEELGDE